MRKRPSRKQDKPRFVYDENLEFIELKKYCSRQALFTSVAITMKMKRSGDLDIIDECEKQNLHVVTHNTSDFQRAREGYKLGIVCVGLKNREVWIPKFSKMLRKLHRHNQFFFKNVYIRDLITIRDRRTGDVRILY